MAAEKHEVASPALAGEQAGTPASQHCLLPALGLLPSPLS